MALNRQFFFEHLHEKLYPDGLQQSQVDGHTAVLDAWDATMAKSDDRWLAYMLATAHHETGTRMQPVRETYATTDEQAASRLQTAWDKGRLPWVREAYWQADGDGKYWFGRGLVQITHKYNYDALGKATKEDLLTDPGVALGLTVAIKIMAQGMIQGLFTTRKLADYFKDGRQDWTGARAIINGTDRAPLIAGYATSYYAALSYTT